MYNIKISGQEKEVSKEEYEVLQKLRNNIPVSNDEIYNIPEVEQAKKRAQEAKSDIIEEIKKNGIYTTSSEIDTMSYSKSKREERARKALSNLQKSRNVIKSEHGEVAKEGKFVLVIGPPSAGKSSCCVDRLSKELKAVIVDNDEVKKELDPEYNEGYGSGLVHKESKEIAIEWQKLLTRDKANIIVPKLGYNIDDPQIDDIVKLAKQSGYKEINVCLVELPREVAMDRLVGRIITDKRMVDPSLLQQCYDSDGHSKCEDVYEHLKASGRFTGHAHISNNVEFGHDPEIIEASDSFSGLRALNEEHAVSRKEALEKSLFEKIDLIVNMTKKSINALPNEDRRIEKLKFKVLFEELKHNIKDYANITGMQDIAELARDAIIGDMDRIGTQQAEIGKECAEEMYNEMENNTDVRDEKDQQRPYGDDD